MAHPQSTGAGVQPLLAQPTVIASNGAPVAGLDAKPAPAAPQTTHLPPQQATTAAPVPDATTVPTAPSTSIQVKPVPVAPPQNPPPAMTNTTPVGPCPNSLMSCCITVVPRQATKKRKKPSATAQKSKPSRPSKSKSKGQGWFKASLLSQASLTLDGSRFAVSRQAQAAEREDEVPGLRNQEACQLPAPTAKHGACSRRRKGCYEICRSQGISWQGS